MRANWAALLPQRLPMTSLVVPGNHVATVLAVVRVAGVDMGLPTAAMAVSTTATPQQNAANLLAPLERNVRSMSAARSLDSVALPKTFVVCATATSLRMRHPFRGTDRRTQGKVANPVAMYQSLRFPKRILKARLLATMKAGARTKLVVL